MKLKSIGVVGFIHARKNINLYLLSFQILIYGINRIDCILTHCHSRSSRTTPSAPPEGAFPGILTLIRTQFPISPHTWAWLHCNTCTSSTHTLISSTLPHTHCEVLICPGCHFWALLPEFDFLLLPLPWFSTLWFFSGCPDSDCLPGLWLLPPAPISACDITTPLPYLRCFHCWWLTLFCLTILNKQSCKWIPLCLMFRNRRLRQTAIQQHWCSWRLNSQLKRHNSLRINTSCKRLTTLTEELVTALQGLRITQPQTAANPPPAPANPPTMQIPSVSPRLAFPERFDGDSTRCKGFLLQCSLFVNQQPSLYPTESSRIAFVCSLLTGKALDWATAVWRTDGSAFPTFDSFLHHFREVFEHPAEGGGAGEQLLALSQGRKTAADYALSFRTLAAQTTWVEDTLKLLFRRGLNTELQSELACRDEGRTLSQFIELTIHIDNLIRARRTVRSAPRSPPRSQNTGEPMQLGFTPLTPQERERRMQNQLCLYCGQAGHMRNTCPVRPTSDRRSVSDITRSISSVSSIKLPVKLRSQNQDIPTTALLDSGAAGNFIDSEFVSQLSPKTNPLYFLLGSGGARRPSPGQGKDPPPHWTGYTTNRNPALWRNPVLCYTVTYPSADSRPSLASNTRSTNILERGTDYGMGTSLSRTLSV